MIQSPTFLIWVSAIFRSCMVKKNNVQLAHVLPGGLQIGQYQVAVYELPSSCTCGQDAGACATSGPSGILMPSHWLASDLTGEGHQKSSEIMVTGRLGGIILQCLAVCELEAMGPKVRQDLPTIAIYSIAILNYQRVPNIDYFWVVKYSQYSHVCAMFVQILRVSVGFGAGASDILLGGRV